jgi:citrate synthase
MHRAFAEKRKLMGFGHRVYKNGDHRAGILHELGKKAAATRGHEFNRLFELGERCRRSCSRRRTSSRTSTSPAG